MSPPTKGIMEFNFLEEETGLHGGHPVLAMDDGIIFVSVLSPAGNIKPDKEKSTEKN